MKFIGSYVLVSLFFIITSANAANFDSAYTSIQSKHCQLLESDRMGSAQSCASFGNIKVQVIEGDLRQSITLIRQGKYYPLDFWRTVSPAFSSLGSLIEWRYQKGQRDTPNGIITRLNVSIGEDAEVTKSYLVVVKITAKAICVVGKISPRAKQNQMARKMVEVSSDMACL
jgi:hypothetical protein